MMSRPAVIIFDVYGTLIDLRMDESRLAGYEFLADWLARHGYRIGARALRRLFREYVGEAMQANAESYPDIEVGAVFRRILDAAGSGEAAGQIPADPGLVEELALLFRMQTTLRLEIFPYTAPLLEMLHGRVRLAICSNAQRQFTMPELRKFGIDGYFERIVFSSDVEASKPNPKIFTAVLGPMGLDPAQAVFVGDNLFDDIWGAQQLGMATVWIDRDGGEHFPAALPRPEPDIQVVQRSQDL